MNILLEKYIDLYNEMKKTTAPLTVRVPGSKSITNRSLLLAMLADGESTLRGVLFSDDSRHFLQCVQDLGFETTVDEDSYVVTVRGLGGKIPCSDASLNVGSAGTAARFLTATLGVSRNLPYGCLRTDAQTSHGSAFILSEGAWL